MVEVGPVPEVYLPDKVKEAMVLLAVPLMVTERVEVLSIIQKVNLHDNFDRFSMQLSLLEFDPHKCCSLKYIPYVCILVGKIRIKLKLRSLLLCICPCVICNYINVFSCLHFPRID